MKFGNYLVEKRVDTTQNASVTELFPALAFNTGNNPKTPEEMRQLVTEMNLQDSGAQESFAAKSNVLSAKESLDLPLFRLSL